MSEKFKGKYRNESTRLQHWDYGWNASYFVTICTQYHECSFTTILSVMNNHFTTFLNT